MVLEEYEPNMSYEHIPRDLKLQIQDFANCIITVKSAEETGPGKFIRQYAMDEKLPLPEFEYYPNTSEEIKGDENIDTYVKRLNGVINRGNEMLIDPNTTKEDLEELERKIMLFCKGRDKIV